MSDKTIPAFPQTSAPYGDGMSLRDYFAAKALGALINEMDMRDPDNVQAGADYAYAFADAMLKAREPK